MFRFLKYFLAEAIFSAFLAFMFSAIFAPFANQTYLSLAAQTWVIMVIADLVWFVPRRIRRENRLDVLDDNLKRGK